MTTQTPNSTTAGATTGKAVTPKDIARAIILDRTPRHDDQMSYAERVAYVLATFDCDTIDFEEVFDYGIAVNSFDLQIICAFRQLAILQSAYANTLWVYNWLTDDERTAITSYLGLMIQHIDWHFIHVQEGVETPPLHIIN